MPELLLPVLIIGVIGWAAYQVNVLRAAHRVYLRVKSEGALLAFQALSASFRTRTLGRDETRWRSAVTAFTPTGLSLYPRQRRMDESLHFPYPALRWFGRPLKYHEGRNEIWLHFHLEDRWQIVKVRLYPGQVADMVRLLKEHVPPELVTAYRRRRPYIHFGPVRVQPAVEDIHGAWTLADAVAIYVMPTQLVILRGAGVLRLIPLGQVQRIAAMRRIDRPTADGLVAFDVEGERLAFACQDYQTLAQAIAEAARRSLEEPLVQKQKGKDEDDE